MVHKTDSNQRARRQVRLLELSVQLGLLRILRVPKCRPGGKIQAKQSRLFQHERDNTHEEPLLLAQFALQHLCLLLERPDLEEETLALISNWFQESLKVSL